MERSSQIHWQKNPCGSCYSNQEFLSKDYFEEIEKHRYLTHSWILENIRGFNIAGKRVLEIGMGMGTDHLALAKQGAFMHGIDLAAKSISITRKRFELYGLQSQLILGDARQLPYQSNSFDFVYSHGVIHHSLHTAKIVSEIHRVLKPGGKCWITVYNKNSIFFRWSVYFVDWLLHRGYKRETLQQRISRIEYPNDNQNITTTLYERKQFIQMFHSFSQVKSRVEHLLKHNISIIGQYCPNRLLKSLKTRYGWYLVVSAVK